MRSPAPNMPVKRDADPFWRAVERALFQRIARRDADYLELHREFLEQQKLLNDYRRYCRAEWAARDLRRVNAEAKA